MENSLEVKNLTKYYGSFKLSDVSFNIPLGGIVGLVGANGAGKTTTLNLIQNIIRKDNGEVLFFGKPSEDRIPQNVAVVADNIYYEKGWKVSELNKIVKRFYDNWNQAEFERLIEKFALDKSKAIGQLSKGMSIKLMIAVALSRNARLLILDEPTSGLDPIARDELCGILLDFVSDKTKSVLFSTHITSDLEKIADDVVFLVNGEIRLNDKKDNIIRKFSNDELKTLDDIIIHLHEKEGVRYEKDA
ncbi:MAG: ABC transporter ATP-binding protein [Defluviitaleaceae bacterium]|nr:ABC transporter ATP-binding protein [Defluviitaleaceae bacterium]